MSDVLHLRGVIRNVVYVPQVRPRVLPRYPQSTFDINRVKGAGIIETEDDALIGYSKWISPKRTRSYPLARLYATYHLPKRITIIPVIKDEGIGGDNDRINFITLSWMNLSNVYVIFAYYAHATKHRSRLDKITAQKFDVEYVNQKISEIMHYQQTALHWNTMHFERDFEQVYRTAIKAYQQIEQMTGITLHNTVGHEQVIESFRQGGQVTIDGFKQATLPRSYQAATRETVTSHSLEYLSADSKSLFTVTNWLGGEYHLTADEILVDEDGTLVIREAKNASRGQLPSLTDIQDGLFKLILFANMDALFIDDTWVKFRVELRLSGNLSGQITLPADDEVIRQFGTMNMLSRGKMQLLRLLNAEANANLERNLKIIVGER